MTLALNNLKKVDMQLNKETKETFSCKDLVYQIHIHFFYVKVT